MSPAAMYSLARRTLSQELRLGSARVGLSSFDFVRGFAPVRRLPSGGELFLDARDVFHGAVVGSFG